MRDLTFNGRAASSFGLHVMRLDPPIGASLTPTTVAVPGRPGDWLFGMTVDAKTIPVQVAIQQGSVASLYASLRMISAWLAVDEAKPLIFSDEPDKVYMAYPVGSTSLERIVTIGQGTINFRCSDPFASDITPTTVAAALGLTAITNTGSAEAWPAITIPVAGDATFIRARIGERTVLVGRPAQADIPTVPTSVVELWDDLTSTSGWVQGTNAQDGEVVGALTSDGVGLVGGSLGTGSAWHGRTSRRAIANSAAKFTMEALVNLDNSVWGEVVNETVTMGGLGWHSLAHPSINGDQVVDIVVTHKSTGYVYTTVHDYDRQVAVEGMTQIRRQPRPHPDEDKSYSDISDGQEVYVSYRYRKAKSGRCEMYGLDESGVRIVRVGVSDASEDTVSTKFYASVWNNGEAKTIVGEVMPSKYDAFKGIMRASCDGAGKWSVMFAKRDPFTGVLSATTNFAPIVGAATSGPLAIVELHCGVYGTIPPAKPMRIDHVKVTSKTDPVVDAPTVIAHSGDIVTIDCESAEIRVNGEIRMDLLDTSSDDFPSLPVGTAQVAIESDAAVSGASIAFSRRWH